MCFDLEKRNPDKKDKSIWDWWEDSKIIAKFKFKNKAESMDSNRVFKIVQNTIFDLQKEIKDLETDQSDIYEFLTKKYKAIKKEINTVIKNKFAPTTFVKEGKL